MAYDMYDPMNPDGRNVPKSFLPLVILSQVIGLFMVIITAVWSGYMWGGFTWDDKRAVFNYHPLFMIIGLVFLYGDSILLYRVFRSYPKIRVKWLHTIVHLSAFIFAVIGLAAVFDMHDRNNIPNLYSLHSWAGITVVTMFVVQWIVSFAVFLFPGMSQPVRAALMPIHTSLGSLLFFGALIAVVSGLTEKNFFSEKYSELRSREMLGNFVGVSAILFVSVVYYVISNRDYRRQETSTSSSEETVVSTHPFATNAP